jgi:hypothetical protein
MASIIYDDPREVERQLRRRFWSDKGQWIEIIKASVAARGGCTADYPKSSPGFHAWSNAVARMRQIFCREGWVKSDQDGIEIIVRHELRVQVAIMNSDKGAADRTRSPRNRTIKRTATNKVTDLNDQIEMFSHAETGPEPTGYPTWYLCILDDGHNVRAELSRQGGGWEGVDALTGKAALIPLHLPLCKGEIERGSGFWGRSFRFPVPPMRI